MWKEEDMAYFEVLSQEITGEQQENHKVPQSDYQVSMLRSEPSTFKILN
jgi:hypothetical protein